MKPVTTRNDNGERFISLKWFVGILVTITLTAAGSWAAQRHSVETAIHVRLSTLEWNQSRVLATLELNRETLQKIYSELLMHRQTGK